MSQLRHDIVILRLKGLESSSQPRFVVPLFRATDGRVSRAVPLTRDGIADPVSSSWRIQMSRSALNRRVLRVLVAGGHSDSRDEYARSGQLCFRLVRVVGSSMGSL